MLISANVKSNPERTWDETGPGLAAFDYTQCAHVMLHPGGRSQLGQQRWHCPLCGQNFTENRRTLTLIDELRLTGPLYKQGMSIADVCCRTGMRLLTVTNLYRGFQRRWPQYYPYDIPRVHGEMKSRLRRKH